MKIRSTATLLLPTALSGFMLAGCALSTHPTRAASLGVARESDALLATLELDRSAAKTVTVETIASADWVVPRSGLINLDHEQAAHLEDGDEPIQIYFHAIRHPEHGLFIIDTGVERALATDPDNAALNGLAASAMDVEKMVIHTPLGDWLARAGEPLRGVFLTHLHLDHVLGMRDVPRGTKIYAGPGETGARAFLNMFVQGVTDRALEGHQAIEEWAYVEKPSDRFAGLIDVFGDGTFWAIWVPGHTAGSTAYLARTPAGPVLFTGDASHTVWGWEHGVEPGTFSSDLPRSRESLNALRALVERYPAIETRLGHQTAASES